MHYLLFLFLVLFSSCQSIEKKLQKRNLKGEYVFRHAHERFFIPPAPEPCVRENYPWEEKYIKGVVRITKDFFRCRGNSLNPVVVIKRPDKEPLYFRDCASHGLPLRDGKEFIFPCLIELLNYVQEKTSKKVVITCGHSCPKHNAYADTSSYNYGSKHMIGAEVDFYVEGMEKETDLIITLLQQYYKEKYPKDKEFSTFQRFDKEGLNVRTPPWYNKEIFIKLYEKDEGRDFDNSHSHPYLSLQVRYDKILKKKVTFDQKAAENYLRH